METWNFPIGLVESFLELHCSQKLFLPQPLFSFTHVRPASWSEVHPTSPAPLLYHSQEFLQ
jgi:hypothetical protein